MPKFLPAVFLAVFFFSCSKNDSDELAWSAQNRASSLSQTDHFYFRGVINGESVSWVIEDQNDTGTPYKYNPAYGIGELSPGCREGECSFIIANTLIQKNNSGAIPQIAAGFVVATTKDDGSRVRPWFLPGNKEFGKPRFSLSDPIKNGVYVYYIDKNNKEWVSHYGSGNQEGSFFESVELKDEPDAAVIHYEKKWKARFTAKVYDRDGNSLTIENAEIYGPILPF